MDPTKPVTPGQAPITPDQPVKMAPTGMSTSATVTGTAPTATVAQPQVQNYVVAPKPMAPRVVDETTRKQTLLGKIFQTLAGGARTEYSIDPKTGQTQTHEVPLKPGEMFRGILAGALTGLAAGAMQHGPGAAGRAFGAGYFGREEQMQEQEQQKKQMAQQEFQNEGEAQERIYRAHADARAQQQSIRDAQRASDLHNLYKLQMREGNLRLSQAVTAENLRIQDQMAANARLGVQPLMVNGQPAPEFDTAAEAGQFAAAHRDELIKGFRGRTLYDMSTGKWQVLQTPPNFDTPRWIGAKMEDGKPVYDKNGSIEPDGTLKDADGHPFAVYDTPNRVSQYESRLLDSRYKTSQILLNHARTAAAHASTRERLHAVTKSALMDQAWDNYNKAVEAGGIDAVDPKTKQPYLSPSQRRLLANGMRLTAANDWTALDGAYRLANEQVPPPGIKEQIAELQGKLARDRSFVEKLETPNPAYLNNYVRNLDTRFGTDTKAKITAIDSDQNQSPENKQKLREMVTGTVPSGAQPTGGESLTQPAQDTMDAWHEAIGDTKPTPTESWNLIQEMSIPSDQQLALARAVGAVAPTSWVDAFAKAKGLSFGQAVANLRKHGIPVQSNATPLASGNQLTGNPSVPIR